MMDVKMMLLQLTLMIMMMNSDARTNIPNLNAQSSAEKELKSAEFSNRTLTLYYVDLEEPDTAYLLDEGDCIYSGHLYRDALSNVLVTGCEDETISIQVHSTVAGDRLFSLENGSIVYVTFSDEDQLYQDYDENDEFETLFPVVAEKNGRLKRDSEEEYDDDFYDYDDEPEENPEFEENSPPLDDNEVLDFPLPIKLIFNINVYLDQYWYQIPGVGTEAQATRKARQVLKHAKKLFDHESLETKMDLQFGDRIYRSSAPHLVATKPGGLDIFDKHLQGPYKIENKYAVTHLHLTADLPGKKFPSVGKATIAEICNEKPKAIVRFTKNELRTAWTVAHELGHTLGMIHDFKTVEGGRGRCQSKKNGITVMNYGSKNPRNVWSDCSNQDFKTAYIRIIVGNGGYCLKSAAISECKCNGKSDPAGGECKTKNTAGKKWCYVDRDGGCSDKKKFFGSDFVSSSACSIQQGGCQEHEWQCETSKKCIPRELRCDYIKRHCSDASDETDCPFPGFD